MVFGHNLRHDHRHLVGRIELTGLLAGTGGEVADEVLIDVAQHVVVLRAVGRDVLDEFDETVQRLGLRIRAVAQLAEASTQRLEDAIIYRGIVLAGQTFKAVECFAQCLHGEDGIFLEPCAEQILVFDEEADVLLAFGNGIPHVRVLVVLHKFRQFVLLPVAYLPEVFHFGIREKLVEDKI